MKKIIFVCLSLSSFSFASSSEQIIYVGDSLAVQTREQAFTDKVDFRIAKFLSKDYETAMGGKNPKWIYDRITKVLQADKNFFQGRVVILSSGYSNDPDGVYISYHEKILRMLLNNGADVRMIGLAKNFYIKNKYGVHHYKPERYNFLAKLAKKYNVKIFPQFKGVDNIHLSRNAIREMNYGL